MKPLLRVSGLSMRFGGLMALTDVSFDAPRDGVMGLIGPNGAGKTTLFNCIAGLYKPTGGEILFRPGHRELSVGGFRPERMTALGVSRTFQNIRLFSSLSVLDNVRIGRHCRTKAGFFGAVLRTPGQRAEEKAITGDSLARLAFVGLEAAADQPASSLCYGDQRRLEIARALAADPKLLLLDEPAAGMNPRETGALTDLIQAIVDSGVSVILIEHDMKLVMKICRSLTVLDHGELIAQGAPREIRDNPRVIEAYLGRGMAHA
ncbi:MAG: ABC transporter ATP-binding protein [Desulfovibrionaceae bacterium]|nr:ABC transporter ATP-binding protein [Desulfovibrionaceae bacterium]MBF0512760.1 ABC transporter ATP-binding protein [Desulfovibrionaceae bacterium]